jgi:hypothetical protein
MVVAGSGVRVGAPTGTRLVQTDAQGGPVMDRWVHRPREMPTIHHLDHSVARERLPSLPPPPCVRLRPARLATRAIKSFAFSFKHCSVHKSLCHFYVSQTFIIIGSVVLCNIKSF